MHSHCHRGGCIAHGLRMMLMGMSTLAIAEMDMVVGDNEV